MSAPATAAARSVHAGTRSTRGARSAGRAARYSRRVSGPARSSAVAAAVALPAPGISLPRERPLRPSPLRPSRPVRTRPSRTARPPMVGGRRRRAEAPGLALRAFDALNGLTGSALFDRLIRGRAWIGLLAFSLIGIVTMQLLVLKLNTGIGSTLQREAYLQRQNTQLGIEDSTSSAGERIELLAEKAGMTIAAPSALRFLRVGASDVSRAATALTGVVQAPASSTQESTTSAPGGSRGTAGSEGLLASASTPAGESGGSAGAAGAEGAEGAAASPASSTGHAGSVSPPSAPSGSPAEASSPPSTPTSVAAAGAVETGPAGGVQAPPQG